MPTERTLFETFYVLLDSFMFENTMKTYQKSAGMKAMEKRRLRRDSVDVQAIATADELMEIVRQSSDVNSFRSPWSSRNAQQSSTGSQPTLTAPLAAV